MTILRNFYPLPTTDNFETCKYSRLDFSAEARQRCGVSDAYLKGAAEYILYWMQQAIVHKLLQTTNWTVVKRRLDSDDYAYTCYHNLVITWDNPKDYTVVSIGPAYSLDDMVEYEGFRFVAGLINKPFLADHYCAFAQWSAQLFSDPDYFTIAMNSIWTEGIWTVPCLDHAICYVLSDNAELCVLDIQRMNEELKAKLKPVEETFRMNPQERAELATNIRERTQERELNFTSEKPNYFGPRKQTSFTFKKRR